MIRALTPSAASARFGPAQAIRKLPYAAFTLVIAAVAACGVGMANIASSPVNAAGDSQRHLAAPDDGAETAAGPAQTRCPGCGVVESIRPLALIADRPAEFEFTVRLRDGSTRVSRTVGKANWHSGDRIMLMGGAASSRN